MSYWTTFCFHGHEPKALHCTHKYLGKLNAVQLELLIDELLNYFDKKPFEHFAANFDLEDLFGPERNIKVHKTSHLGPFTRYADIRERLDKYREDDYQSYIPHVTYSEPVIGILDRYALMNKDEVLLEWRA